MTIQEALEKAVAGGYHIQGADGAATHYSGATSEHSLWTRKDNESSFMVPVEETFLDPDFWRSLGRTLGWDTACGKSLLAYEQWWKDPWHHFLDVLAAGKPAKDFFSSLTRLTWA